MNIGYSRLPVAKKHKKHLQRLLSRKPMAMERTSGSSLMRPRTKPKAVPDCRRASVIMALERAHGSHGCDSIAAAS